MADGQTTFEEARSCPRCGQYGEERTRHPGERGSTVYVFVCKTEGCKWEDTTWLVQVNRDGSIPTRNRDRMEKEFKPLTETQKTHARDIEAFTLGIMERGEW